jgi:hypothetical protein
MSRGLAQLSFAANATFGVGAARTVVTFGRVGFVHFALVIVEATVAGRNVTVVALYNLIKGKEFYLGWWLFSGASKLIVFNLLPQLRVNAKSFHLVPNFLNQTLGSLGHRVKLLAIF